MDEATFQMKLQALITEIGTLPENSASRQELEATVTQVQERHRQLRDTVAQLQESIDFVRLSVKYLLFDLEATRRENQQLRQMLEDGGK